MNVTNVAARLPRTNSEPLPSQNAKPQLGRTQTAPAALGSPKPVAPAPAKDTFESGPSASKPSALKGALGKVGAVGGLASGLNGIVQGVRNLVGDSKSGQDGHTI